MAVEPPKETDVEKVFEWSEAALQRAGVRYLQRYPASKVHFLRIMNRKIQRSIRRGADPSHPYEVWLNGVVERCESMGLLNDALLARALACSLHRRGVSLRAMRQRLRRKGLSDDAIEAAIAELYEETESPDLAAAMAYARRRRLGPFGAPETRRENYRRDLQKLARQGFRFQVAKEVLETELDEMDKLFRWP